MANSCGSIMANSCGSIMANSCGSIMNMLVPKLRFSKMMALSPCNKINCQLYVQLDDVT